jgi:aspartate racemase
MKTIGIIGGLSPASTISYYRGINAGIQKALGGQNSAKIILSSVNFGEFVDLKARDDWKTQCSMLVAEARRLDRAGVDLIILATNTMHMFADEIQAAVSVPFLHLADATAACIKAKGLSEIALLGTRFTMEKDFYKERLRAAGLKVMVPGAADIEMINTIIYTELCRDIITEASRKACTEIMTKLVDTGAEGVILGCTEIGLLISDKDSSVPLFDTTQIHVSAAAEAILTPS